MKENINEEMSRRLDGIEQAQADILARLDELAELGRIAQLKTLKTSHVAALLGITSASVARLARAGSLPGTQTDSGQYLFKRSDIDAYMAERRRQSRQEIKSKAEAYCITHPLH